MPLSLKFKYFRVGLFIIPPEHLETAVQEDSIKLSFKMDNTTGIKHYEIELETDEGKNRVETNDNSESYVIKNLQSETKYKIRMRAVSHNDRKSKWSTSVTAYICKLCQIKDQLRIQPSLGQHCKKNKSLPLRISPVNVTKSAVSCNVPKSCKTALLKHFFPNQI